MNMGELSIDNLSTDTMNTDISMGDLDIEGVIMVRERLSALWEMQK